MTRSELVRHLTRCEGAAEYAALYIGEVARGVDRWFQRYETPADDDHKVAVYVQAYRQGYEQMYDAYFERIMQLPEVRNRWGDSLRLPDNARFDPQIGRNVIAHKDALLKALKGDPCDLQAK